MKVVTIPPLPDIPETRFDPDFLRGLRDTCSERQKEGKRRSWWYLGGAELKSFVIWAASEGLVVMSESSHTCDYDVAEMMARLEWLLREAGESI